MIRSPASRGARGRLVAGAIVAAAVALLAGSACGGTRGSGDDGARAPGASPDPAGNASGAGSGPASRTGSSTAPGAASGSVPGTEPSTPIEQRRHAACEQLGPKLTACAVDDARAALAAGKVTRADFERDTAPGVQRKNTEDFLRVCKATAFSSRQVRVLEVCFRSESACPALLECLDHLNDRDVPAGPRR